MKLLKKIFSANTLILLFSVAFFIAFIGQLVQLSHNEKDLTLHEGIVEEKSDVMEPANNEDPRAILIKLSGDTAHYSASRYAGYINDHIDIGDTIQLFTKEMSAFGNMVSDELGGRMWTTHNPNEVFHLVSNKNKDTIIDFKENQQHLKKLLWLFPLFSLLCLGWFLYRRSGRKSRFIFED